jgi:transposase
MRRTPTVSQLTPTYVGLDVSKKAISVALLRPDGRLDEDRIANTPEAVRSLVRRWSDPGAVRACYEAGPTGYVLYRELTDLGIACTVIAPSLTPRRPGERIKTDRRDARKLAGLLRAGELTAVRVPSEAEEAARDLLRARDDAREDRNRARQRLSHFLLRHGRVYAEGVGWTVRHRAWLNRQCFEDPVAQQTLEYYRTTVDLRSSEVARLDAEIAAVASSEPFRAGVATLSSLRGISTLSALTLLAEVGDFRRFRRAGEFMAFTGLVPSERSSGERRRQGSITKTGNRFVRRILVEAAWNATRRPNLGPAFARRTQGQPAEVVTIAARAQDRLHARYWHLVGHRKPAGVAAVAVARELAGFCWALMTQPA